MIIRIALAAALLTVSATAAPPFPPLVRVPVLEAAIPAANPPVGVVRGARIRFAPGQPTGRHRHPVSVAGVVTEGTFRFQIEGEAMRVLKTGDAFFEPAGRAILQFDNASNSAPAALIAFYLTDRADRPLIEPLNPP